MKKLRNLIVVLLVFTLIVAIGNVTKAATGDSYTVKLTSNKTQLEAGDEFTVSITLDNINILSGEKGLGSYQGKLVYDSNVVELVKDKVEAGNGWDTPTINEGLMTAVRSDGEVVSTTQTVAIVTFKVKAGVTADSITIKTSNFEASNATENIPTSDAVLTINMKKETKTETKTTTQNTAKPANTTQATKILPKTGVTKVAGVVIALVSISGLATYIRYRSIRLK